MPSKALCIHGHFYQPPREDPITGTIPPEPGAAPYKNWNERIHAECYRPNAELGNFDHISYNIGPTLLQWIETHDPQTYKRIIAGDRKNVARYGVGNAIAQAYNHTILPLASSEDKVIQVAWGIADFKHRFGRKPQGMWLPETAVNAETLTVLAKQGIEFTILAPWQADSKSLDPTEAYRVALPEGQSITVFFYHGDLSGGVSFNPALTFNADIFALHNLIREYNSEKERNKEAQLLLLASDGELYGHHQPNRERFLAHLVDGASIQAGIVPMFPALWLKNYPAQWNIAIRDNTSWSCHHGVTRWVGECGCNPPGGHWKTHLRRSLDRLAAALDWLYFDAVYPYISKPRVLRERYIHVMLGEITVEGLIQEMIGRALTNEQTLRISLLLESQRERQRMYTSCGWFFDDFDRLEPQNNLAYAAQAVRLAHLATGEDLSQRVIYDLKNVISHRTGLRGDKVFIRQLERTWVMGNKNFTTQ